MVHLGANVPFQGDNYDNRERERRDWLLREGGWQFKIGGPGPLPSSTVLTPRLTYRHSPVPSVASWVVVVRRSALSSTVCVRR